MAIIAINENGESEKARESERKYVKEIEKYRKNGGNNENQRRKRNKWQSRKRRWRSGVNGEMAKKPAAKMAAESMAGGENSMAKNETNSKSI
jgi:hypothetical protein